MRRCAANPGWPVRMLVTLGSPLGIPNLIFDRLQPAPPPAADARAGPRGRWPGPGRAWVNVADQGDVVALVKDLRGAFGPRCRLLDRGQRRDRPRCPAVSDCGADRPGHLEGRGQRILDGSGLRLGLMEARVGNRFLLTCAMTRYEHCAEWDREELREDVARMVGLFCGDFLPEAGRYTHADVLGESPTSVELKDRLRDFFLSTDRHPDD